MAFVLVQHLAPDHKSLLSQLIGRYTRMQVLEVQDAMVVQANCVYIIAPNYDMSLRQGVLHLLEPAAPRGQRLPIDYFFQSLAQDQAELAIGIVLSGSGSDCARGVRAIKNAGGMVMAQNPTSCEFDGMPRSAIATGLVDYQLEPAQMPALPATAVKRPSAKTRVCSSRIGKKAPSTPPCGWRCERRANGAVKSGISVKTARPMPNGKPSAPCATTTAKPSTMWRCFLTSPPLKRTKAT